MSLFSKDEPKRYEIDDKQLVCLFCSNDTFDTRREQLHSPTRTILNLNGPIGPPPVLYVINVAICTGFCGIDFKI